MTRLVDYPGISPRSALEEKGYFEEAYDMGEGLVMRARFTPIHDQLYIEGEIPIDVAPNSVCVTISRSLVDKDGQVLYVATRGVVRDATTHKTYTNSDIFRDREGFPAMTVEDWLDTQAMEFTDDLIKSWSALNAFSFLIVKPNRVPPPTGTIASVFEEPTAPVVPSMMWMTQELPADEVPAPPVPTEEVPEESENG